MSVKSIKSALFLKGALKAGAVAGSSVTADYDSLAGGTKLNISVKSGDKYVDGSTRSICGDKAGADTMNITVANAVINLGNGNDFVTVSDPYCSINAARLFTLTLLLLIARFSAAQTVILFSIIPMAMFSDTAATCVCKLPKTLLTPTF